MKLPILASFIILIGFVSLFINRSNRQIQKSQEDFWERERQANQVRRKPLDNLNYVTLALSELPVTVDTENPTVKDCIEVLEVLKDQKCVCLSGISNTDLKFTYGTANITELSRYDENFTLLATTLQKWAAALYADGFTDETVQVLEYAVSVQSDAGTSYRLLAEIYENRGEQDKVRSLYEKALALPSSSAELIAKTLKEQYSYI